MFSMKRILCLLEKFWKVKLREKIKNHLCLFIWKTSTLVKQGFLTLALLTFWAK